MIGATTHKREIARPLVTLGESANVLILVRQLQLVDPKVERGDGMVGRCEGWDSAVTVRIEQGCDHSTMHDAGFRIANNVVRIWHAHQRCTAFDINDREAECGGLFNLCEHFPNVIQAAVGTIIITLPRHSYFLYAFRFACHSEGRVNSPLQKPLRASRARASASS